MLAASGGAYGTVRLLRTARQEALCGMRAGVIAEIRAAQVPRRAKSRLFSAQPVVRK
jgi:hypothetical protein